MTGLQLGLVVVPGAQIPGQLYQPLAEEVQRQLGAQLWLGVTRDWLGSFPNPVEISGAVQDCMSQVLHNLECFFKTQNCPGTRRRRPGWADRSFWRATAWAASCWSSS